MLSNPIVLAIAASLLSFALAGLYAFVISPRLEPWLDKQKPGRRRNLDNFAKRAYDIVEGIKLARPGGVEDPIAEGIQVLISLFRQDLGRGPNEREVAHAKAVFNAEHRKGRSLQLDPDEMEPIIR